MAKKKKEEKKPEVFGDIDVTTALKDCYLSYAMASFIRTIPSAIDGLKPSQRRILYTLKNMKATSFTKSADVVGQSMQLIPHGDQSTYGTLVNLTQEDRVRNTLVVGQGNLGYITQSLSEFAAARYTEVKMSEYLQDFYFTEDFNYTDTMPTYKGLLDVVEPVVFPSLLPMLLVQGSRGITPGFACNCVPHNLLSVADSYIDYIKNREKPTQWNKMEKRILDTIKIDFPNSCNIIRESDTGLKTGKGQILVQGRFRLKDASRGKKIIQVYELPYLVECPDFVNKCDMVFNKHNMLYAVSDESGKDGILINIILKKDVSMKKAIEMLKALTPFTSSYNYSLLVNKNGEPKRMGVLEIFEHHYQYKRSILEKYYNDRKNTLDNLKMCLDGALYILGNPKRKAEFIKMLETSTRQNILKNIQHKWNLNPDVGDYLINKKFSSLLNGVENMVKEKEEIDKEYLEVVKILNDIDKYMIKRITTIVKKYNKGD